jgi:short subunit dehydrogenase-like uncharacterized protein
LLDYAYGRALNYSEQMDVGSSVLAPIAAAVVTGANAVAWNLLGRFFRFVPRGLVNRVVPAPGTGPDEHTRDSGHYRLETYTTTGSGARYRAVMAQQGDPGYKATAVLLAQCALALATDRDAISDLCGVLTPAASIGDVLLERLPAAGVTLQTEMLN